MPRRKEPAPPEADFSNFSFYFQTISLLLKQFHASSDFRLRRIEHEMASRMKWFSLSGIHCQPGSCRRWRWRNEWNAMRIFCFFFLSSGRLFHSRRIVCLHLAYRREVAPTELDSFTWIYSFTLIRADAIGEIEECVVPCAGGVTK